MNDVSLDALRSKPARQPEAVVSSFERHSGTYDPAAFHFASARQWFNTFSNARSSIASFFNGWCSTPGTRPATSQLDWLIHPPAKH
jgi:hypothetical protein